MCVVRFGVLWCGPTNYFVTPNLNYNWGGLWQQFIWCGDHIFNIVQRKICNLNIRRRPSTPKRANQCWLNTLFIHIGHLQCKTVWNFNINSTILYCNGEVAYKMISTMWYIVQLTCLNWGCFEFFLIRTNRMDRQYCSV